MTELQVEIDDVIGDEMASLTPSEQEPARTTRFVIVAAIMAAIGGILFGYDIGIVSGAMLQLKEDFELSCQQQEMVVSLLLVGALIGALFGGFFVDWIGRRWAIILNTAIFITGAAVLAVAPVYGVLIVGRLIVGFAVSLSAIAECIYISEISPMKQRGRLVCVNEIGITLGILLAYLVNYFLISVPSGWRYMFGLSVFPALVQGVGMIFLPPSPRFLMQKGKEPQAQIVLQKLRGTQMIDGELSSIRNSLLTEHEYKVCDVLSAVDNMRGRFLVGVGLVFFQQFTGQTNVLYYAPTIFQSLGFGNDAAATLATVGLGLVKVVSTTICLCCVDRAGRRHFLLAGAGIMAVIIVTLGIVAQVSLPTQAKRPCIAHTSPEVQSPGPIVQTPGNTSFGKSSTKTLYSDEFILTAPSRIQREIQINHKQTLQGIPMQDLTETSFSEMQYTSKHSNKNTFEIRDEGSSELGLTQQGSNISALKHRVRLPGQLKDSRPTGFTSSKLDKYLESSASYLRSKRALSDSEAMETWNHEQLEVIQKHSMDAQSRISTDAFSGRMTHPNIQVSKGDVGNSEHRNRIKRVRVARPVRSTANKQTVTTSVADGTPGRTTSVISVQLTASLAPSSTEMQTPTNEVVSTDRLSQTSTPALISDKKDLLSQSNIDRDLDTTAHATSASINETDFTTVNMTGSSAETPSKTGPGIAQIVAFISLTLYVGAYSYGFGPVTWLVLSEIFPVGIRGRASSLATVFNWGTNVLVSLTFLDVMNGIGPSWTFLLYGLICAVSFIFIYCVVPETKNRSLEQISAALKKKSNLTGLPGHCCLQRAGICSCCHSNSHQHLLLMDSGGDAQGTVNQETSLVETDSTVI